ncbi:hypothetical protein [Frondihabitans cladoniiphilus]|uniref:Uncharacterized protein n=1 Tax=Frondihabitans cladoniiphilus TaxID=715785 RepID=A0ABP8VXX3_9MICO
MNGYGELARDLWRAADERRFLALPDRDVFFTELGSDVARRVDELVVVFAGETPPGETPRCRARRLRRALKQAEEIAYQELIFSHSVVAESELEADVEPEPAHAELQYAGVA